MYLCFSATVFRKTNVGFQIYVVDRKLVALDTRMYNFVV